MGQNGEDIVSSNNSSNDVQLTSTSKKFCDSEDEKGVSISRKNRLKQFSDSDSDGTNIENDTSKSNLSTTEHGIHKKSDSDSTSDNNVFDSKRKSRIRKIAQSGSESESHSEKDDIVSSKRYDFTRIKNKNQNLLDKFKQFKNAGKSGKKEDATISHPEPSSDDDSNEESQVSDEGESCLKIKQKTKRKSVPFKPSVCDPDTSDEENTLNIKEQKSRPGSTKLTSPKPIRMTAKQAMENMQKIKSESNRMLREKDISLPYHRPKALTLKDIMNRRKPGLTSDGKTLPIKMNNEQLKQYVLLLEERQKEMMELCKSDSSEEEEETKMASNKEQQSKNCHESIVNDIQLDNETNYLQIACNDQVEDVRDRAENTDKQLDIHREKYVNKIGESKANVEIVPIEPLPQILDQSENTNKGNNEENTNIMETEDVTQKKSGCVNDTVKGIEDDRQIISLHYDAKQNYIMEVKDINVENKVPNSKKLIDDINQISSIETNEEKDNLSIKFSDNDFTMEELDNIESFETPKEPEETFEQPSPTFESMLNLKPKLTGAPGMVIDLEPTDSGSSTQKKLTGVEILKERYVYFAKLQCQEDMEKDREKKYKPGTQHFQLKQELEEQIAEQRSLEWAKRLEEENKLKAEINPVGDEEFDDIEKIEAKLEENEPQNEKEDSSSEEEEVEDMDICDSEEKQKERNPMIDDEAEVSGDEDYDEGFDTTVKETECNEANDNDNSDDIESEKDDDSSESEEEEEQAKPRKGRILKAFEDSDDEDSKKESDAVYTNHTVSDKLPTDHQNILESQDDELQLAQLHKSFSEDLFTSQSSNVIDKDKDADTRLENDLGSQTFSIANAIYKNVSLEKEASFPDKLDVICETQPCNDDNFDAVVGMCSGSFSQNFVAPQFDSTQLSQSQEIGDDVLALCTGQFYDNPLVSQTENENLNTSKSDSANVSLNMTDVELHSNATYISNIDLKNDNSGKDKVVDNQSATKDNIVENKLLKSILDELDDPEFDAPKPNKYFFNSNKSQNKDILNVDDSQPKKKLVIESDDEMNENTNEKKKKKLKKRKLERRALQISDDEEEESLEDEEEIYESQIEQDGDKEVEYDSEENEVEVKTKGVKKKRLGRDFFEQEAELTSEDEWMGSGDEDEAGLDRMEREEGDDDTFHQGQLQKELGQIHMREVLDQDKREVRILQELLFEDGDLGDGHRQRKFRWKNADGKEETGTNVDEYLDTQEEEFESEEQWRKQRHEREMFLRKMQEKEDDCINISINRSTIIKASLCPKSAPSLHAGNNAINTEKLKSPPNIEKKTTKDIPSPKKPFVIFQQNYHNSLLTRGRGALARLAALATPLAGDADDGPKVIASSNRGNFVFAAIASDDVVPKVTKRKAETNPGTPRLLKKMRVDETNQFSKNSLLDHL